MSTSSFFVAQVLIHLVTRTIAVVLNIGIDTYYQDSGRMNNIRKDRNYRYSGNIPDVRNE